MKKQTEIPMWVRILLLPVSYFIMILKIAIFIPAYVIGQINSIEDDILV